MTSGSDDYMVMSIKKKNVMELKIPGTRVQVDVSGKNMWLWVDSGSPVTIFSMTDLKATLGKTKIQLQPPQEEYLDYNNNRRNILGTHTVSSWARSDGYPRPGDGAKKEGDGNHGGREQSGKGGV